VDRSQESIATGSGHQEGESGAGSFCIHDWTHAGLAGGGEGCRAIASKQQRLGL
jgi:hypothetical protein